MGATLGPQSEGRWTCDRKEEGAKDTKKQPRLRTKTWDPKGAVGMERQGERSQVIQGCTAGCWDSQDEAGGGGGEVGGPSLLGARALENLSTKECKCIT